MQRRTFVAGVGAASAAWFGASSAWSQDRGALSDTAFDPRMWAGDLAVTNARVITMDPAMPEAEAVLIRYGRVASIGGSQDILREAQGVPVLDARGRGVVPGFVDTHAHLEWTAATRKLVVNLWEPAPRTMADALRRIRHAVNATPAGRWVVVEGAFSTIGLPSPQQLDAITQRHPLVVFDNVHLSVANTLGAQGMGYSTEEELANYRWRTTHEPASGGFAERDAQGRPHRAFDLVSRLPRNIWTAEELESALAEIARETWTAGGATSVSSMGLVSNNEFVADQRLHASGRLPLRVRGYYTVPFASDMESILESGLTRGFGTDMFRIGGFKFFFDMVAEYTDYPIRRTLTNSQLTDLITRAHAAGFQTMTHCLTQEGAEITVAAVEETRRRLPASPNVIHRIEHQRPASMEFAARMRRAGVDFSMIAPQGLGAWDGGPEEDWTGIGAPYRSWIAAGVRPILISDKCSGDANSPRPLRSVAALCNTIEEGGMCPPGETIGFNDAIRIWTLWSAQSSHQDADRGSISVGKLGDLVLLNADPRAMAPRDYASLSVDATILGGKVVYES